MIHPGRNAVPLVLAVAALAATAFLGCRQRMLPVGSEPDAYRRALAQNRQLNDRYAALRQKSSSTRFDAYFAELDAICSEKRALTEALDRIPPAPPYIPLERALRNSIASDIEFLSISRHSLKLTVSSVTNLGAVLEGMQGDDAAVRAGQSTEADRQQALKRMVLLRQFMQHWQEQLQDVNQQAEAANGRAVRNLDALNREIERLQLPDQHRNVFREFDTK